MSALLESFAAAFASLRQPEAAGLGDARRATLADALRGGLPGTRSEAWKYTSLRALERRAFAPPAALSADVVDAVLRDSRIADLPSPRLVFVDGQVCPAACALDDLPTGLRIAALSAALREGDARETHVLQRRYVGTDAVFATLNAALAEEGAVIQAEAGVVFDRPVHLAHVSSAGAADTAVHLRHLLDLRNDTALTVVEHHIALGTHRGLINHVTHVHLGQRARLTHARVQAEADGASVFTRSDAVLAREADYRRLDLELGAALSRHELDVRLEGEQCRLTANGVLLADGKRHVDTRLGIEHIARDTTCALLWRGLGAGRGRAVFHGGITIREGADGSDADLSNKNLLLSADAEIDTQPVLVIHADEVKAAHGATVGQLDPTALFYLRSRGLPEAEARALLTIAFCREVLAAVDDVGLRATLTALLDTHLDRVTAR